MKKLVAVLFLCLTLALSAIGFAACDNLADNSNSQILSIYNTYVAYAEENGETPLSYEEWLAQIKGEKGDKGDKGDAGISGRTPEIRVLNGYIQWKYTDETEWHTLSTVEVVTVENPQELDFYLKNDGTYEVKAGRAALLEEIVIPDIYKGRPVTSIGDKAFDNCSLLKSITIPNSVVSVGYAAFSGCDNLQYNEYDNGLYLGSAENPYLVLVKSKSTDVTSCEIHNDTKIIYSLISYNAFSTLTIPDGVICIVEGAFRDQRFTVGINISENNKNYKCIDGNLYSKDGKTLIQYTDYKAKTFIIPDGVSRIANYAFMGFAGLEDITIPDSVTSIGSYAFYYCSGLKSIKFNGTVKQWDKISKGDRLYGIGNLWVYCIDGDAIID